MAVREKGVVMTTFREARPMRYAPSPAGKSESPRRRPNFLPDEPDKPDEPDTGDKSVIPAIVQVRR